MSNTTDGTFGEMWINGVKVCETVENLGKEIPEGLYNAKIDFSPRLQYLCPHLRIPLRDEAAGGDAGIRIHIANAPCQLEGCVAVGLSIDDDAVDNSHVAFQKMMSLLPPAEVPFKVLIYAQH